LVLLAKYYTKSPVDVHNIIILVDTFCTRFDYYDRLIFNLKLKNNLDNK